MPRLLKTILARVAVWESTETRVDARRAMKLIRQNKDMAEILGENVEYQYDHDGNRQAAPQGVFTDFFQWLLDHKDAIIALIKEIIALFMSFTELPGEDGISDAAVDSPRQVWENALNAVATVAGGPVKDDWTIAHVNTIMLT